ncbi:LCP family glycopolymer transferase [Isobaculum melis]|nr:LCP family protein [Isobaculum melis]
MSKGKKIIIWTTSILTFVLLGVGVYAYKVFSDVKETTAKIYKKVEKEEVREEPVDVDKGHAFSILLLGIDTGDMGRTEQGRSDSLMVLTVNPDTNTTKILSIPRDTYTEIVGHGTTDKINHAYAFGGASMTINTIQKLLDIPIDYYVQVDLKGIKEIVDAVGGVDVKNDLDFTYENAHFEVGTQHLTGELASKYARMRYDDPKGDYGRQGRQRQIIEAVVKKAATFSTITNYQGILNSLENNLKTNLTFDDMVDIQGKYKGAVKNIEQVQMQGTGQMIDGISYQIVSPEELTKITKQLKEQLEQ